MLVPHLLKIYFGLGWPSSVLEIVSSQRLKTNVYLVPKLLSKSVAGKECSISLKALYGHWTVKRTFKKSWEKKI